MNNFQISKDYLSSTPKDFLKSLISNEEVQKNQLLTQLIKEVLKKVKASLNIFTKIREQIPGKGNEPITENLSYDKTPGYMTDLEKIFNSLGIDDRYFNKEFINQYVMLEDYLKDKGVDFETADIKLDRYNRLCVNDEKYLVMTGGELEELKEYLNSKDLPNIDRKLILADLNDFNIIKGDDAIVEEFLKEKHFKNIDHTKNENILKAADKIISENKIEPEPVKEEPKKTEIEKDNKKAEPEPNNKSKKIEPEKESKPEPPEQKEKNKKVKPSQGFGPNRC